MYVLLLRNRWKLPAVKPNSWMGFERSSETRQLGQRVGLGMALPNSTCGADADLLPRYVLSRNSWQRVTGIAHWIADRQSAPLNTFVLGTTSTEREITVPPICRGESYILIACRNPIRDLIWAFR